jgi:ribosomal protein L16 Arg81 hydroxylase
MLRGRKRETASANPCVAIARETNPSPEFTALIEPHAPDVFLRDTWEKLPLVIRRGQPDRYQSLLSLTSMDTLISLLGINPGRKEIRLVRTRRGKLIEKSAQTTASGYADAFWLYAAYHEGYTIVLNGIDRRWPPIALLCRRLETELRHHVGANVYFTPTRSQGFLPHFDGHDVFILQVEGTKCWHVFRAMADLPLENTPSDFDPRVL